MRSALLSVLSGQTLIMQPATGTLNNNRDCIKGDRSGCPVIDAATPKHQVSVMDFLAKSGMDLFVRTLFSCHNG
jgi:hypothetical protein